MHAWMSCDQAIIGTYSEESIFSVRSTLSRFESHASMLANGRYTGRSSPTTDAKALHERFGLAGVRIDRNGAHQQPGDVPASSLFRFSQEGEHHGKTQSLKMNAVEVPC